MTSFIGKGVGLTSSMYLAHNFLFDEGISTTFAANALSRSDTRATERFFYAFNPKYGIRPRSILGLYRP